MDLFEIKLDGCFRLVFTVHLLLIAIIILIIVVLHFIQKRFFTRWHLKRYEISEATIGIGSNTIAFTYDNRIKEIAYKIWVELITRKIGLRFDEGFDVIDDVYDSWYAAFRVIRNLLEEIPANRIKDANGLIELITKVLNDGLRPHLTKWQAKFRSWYEKEAQKDLQLSPQELQRRFPEYESLVSDLKKTNEIMISFENELKRFIDDEDSAKKRSYSRHA